MTLKLKDLNPGDVFRYLDGRKEFLTGLFMKLHQQNTYIKPMASKRADFIVSLDDGMPYKHADYREVEIVLKYKEEIMENKMGHFIGWKFGVPVRVSSRNFSQPYTETLVLLIQETNNTFTVSFENFIKKYSKEIYCYELIPYKYGDVMSPRYPVCLSPNYTAYCNSRADMTILDSTPKPFYKYPTATLTIDGKTIELSAETTAEWKKKLGV